MGNLNQCCNSSDAKAIAYDAPEKKKLTANQQSDLPQSNTEIPKSNALDYVSAKLLQDVQVKLNQDVQAKIDAYAEDPMAAYEGQDIDLPIIPVENITDRFAEFELKLPFSRTLLTRFMEKIDNAEKANGSQGFITIQQLASELKTPVWQGLNSDADQLYRFMTSGIFKVIG